MRFAHFGHYKNNNDNMIEGYIAEDIALATHADLPPLQTTFPAPGRLSNSLRRGLQAGLDEQLLFNVSRAQEQGWLPNDDDLATLPAFQAALKEDAHHIKTIEEEAAARKEARSQAMKKAQLLEAERQRLAAEQAEAEAKQKREAKEIRRLARLAAKKEAREKTRAEEMRRYEDLHSRWQITLDERQAKLDQLETAIKSASDRKAAVHSRLSELSENKAVLLKKLRDLATNTSQKQQQQQQQQEKAPLPSMFASSALPNEPSLGLVAQGSSAGLPLPGLSGRGGPMSVATSAPVDGAIPSSGYYGSYRAADRDRDTWEHSIGGRGGGDIHRPFKRSKDTFYPPGGDRGGLREFEPRGRDYASLPYESRGPGSTGYGGIGNNNNNKPGYNTNQYNPPPLNNDGPSNPSTGQFDTRTNEYYNAAPYRGGGNEDVGWRRGGYDHEPASHAAPRYGGGGGASAMGSPGKDFDRGGGSEFGSYLRHEDKSHRGGGGGDQWGDLRGEDTGNGGKYGGSGRRQGYDGDGMHNSHRGPAGAAGGPGPGPGGGGGFNRPLSYEEREKLRQQQGGMHRGDQEQRREGYGGRGGGGRGWGRGSYQGR